MRYAELAVTTNFTFLTGASHPEEMVERAAELGLEAIAITDRNTLAGVVRAHQRLREMARDAVPLTPRNIVTADVWEHAAAVRAKRQAASPAERSWRAAAGAAARERDAAAPAPPPQPLGGGKGPPDLLPTPPKPPSGEGAPRPGGGARALPPGPAEGARPRVRSHHRVDASSRMAKLPPERLPDDEVRPLVAKSLPRLVIGARLAFGDTDLEVLALAPDRAAYAGLARLLTLGKTRAEKGQCDLRLADLLEHPPGLVLVACPPDPLTDPLDLPPDRCRPRGAGPDAPPLRRLARRFGADLFVGATPRYDGRDGARIAAFARIAARVGRPLVATGDVLMHRASRRRLADVLCAIREGCTVDALGRRALPNAERRLRPPQELARLYAGHEDALVRAADIAQRCTFSLDELSYEYPDEGDGEAPQARLERLTEDGLAWRYPDGAPPRVRELVGRELRLIGKLGYAPYFLTVHDIVAFARGRGILAQGRGSAANSVVCYALGITEIAPDTISMVFERFVSEARDEPPDIDVDFEHERREEVIQHIYQKYGRERAGLCATVIHFRTRAAIREVGKVMGLSEDVTAALAGQVWGWSRETVGPERLVAAGLDPADRRLVQTLELVEEIQGFPRHLSQHVGGFVITAGRLDELCPIENAAMEDRTVIEWDKDDIDALGILKVDVLALGMLTCIRKAFDLIRRHGGPDYTLATLPAECGQVYDMLCNADSLGVFQVESRAQMNFLPRMRPRTFYDLVIEVAIVRPGPIQGDMVHPYLRRRMGEEAVEFPSDELAEVLGKTLGVPLFQEQAMRIAIVAAGFDPEEADRLRRALATFRKTGTIGTFRERFVGGMIARGYDPAFAERCFSQIEGFGEYGFPESHAASFALLVYASAWIKCHHPAVFACALLNAQPMGFYAPAQIVRDARAHGVEVRPVSVNHSCWDCTLEPGAEGLALRLGFRLVKGLREEDGHWIAAARGNGYPDIESLWRRAGIGRAGVTRLAGADAFAPAGLARRDALWEARALSGEAPLPLFADGEGLAEAPPALPRPSDGEEVVADYRSVGLSLRRHPMAILRPMIEAEMAAGR